MPRNTKRSKRNLEDDDETKSENIESARMYELQKKKTLDAVEKLSSGQKNSQKMKKKINR